MSLLIGKFIYTAFAAKVIFIHSEVLLNLLLLVFNLFKYNLTSLPFLFLSSSLNRFRVICASFDSFIPLQLLVIYHKLLLACSHEQAHTHSHTQQHTHMERDRERSLHRVLSGLQMMRVFFRSAVLFMLLQVHTHTHTHSHSHTHSLTHSLTHSHSPHVRQLTAN